MNNALEFWDQLQNVPDYHAKIDAIAAYCKENETFYAKEWVDRLLSGNQDIYIFGAGQFGIDLHELFLSKIGINVVAYCDNAQEKWDTRLVNGMACISPIDLVKRYQYAPCKIVVASNYYSDDIYKQCIDMGIDKESLFVARPFLPSWLTNYHCATKKGYMDFYIDGIKWLITQLADDASKQLCVQLTYRRLIDFHLELLSQKTQYFIPEFPIKNDEIFVDVGAYTGDTLIEFANELSAQSVNPERVQYHALECSPQNYSKLSALLHDQKFEFQVNTYPVALWNENSILKFNENQSSSQMSQNGYVEVKACKLDDLLVDTPIKWVKMDIEGAELKALHGCEHLIRRFRPRLSICVYHCPDDIFEIPKYIRSLNADYKMLLRHHGEYDNETVLYAF